MRPKLALLGSLEATLFQFAWLMKLKISARNCIFCVPGSRKFLKKAMSQIESEDGWVTLGAVGKQVANLFSDFDERTYGHGKLSDLVRKTGAFDLEKLEGNSMRMRAKLPDSSAKKGKIS